MSNRSERGVKVWATITADQWAAIERLTAESQVFGMRVPAARIVAVLLAKGIEAHLREGRPA